MKRVKIALMGSYDSEERVCIMQTYLNSLWEAGAMGVLLQYRTDPEFLQYVVEEFDGFLFCGGDDIDPALYGETNTGSKNICSVRDGFELAVFDAIWASGKPIFGICRGIQMMNVALGGSMHQHIYGHSQETPKTLFEQKILITDGGLLHSILNKNEIFTNTFHHQCVKELGRGLVIDAMSDDGYIEAIHLEGHKFCLGVQWHPEYCYGIDDASTKIFDAFIKACR